MQMCEQEMRTGIQSDRRQVLITNTWQRFKCSSLYDVALQRLLILQNSNTRKFPILLFEIWYILYNIYVFEKVHRWWNLLFLFVMVHLAEGLFSESLWISFFFFFFLRSKIIGIKQLCFLCSVAIHQRQESIHRLSYIWLIYWRRITGRKSNYLFSLNCFCQAILYR